MKRPKKGGRDKRSAHGGRGFSNFKSAEICRSLIMFSLSPRVEGRPCRQVALSIDTKPIRCPMCVPVHKRSNALLLLSYISSEMRYASPGQWAPRSHFDREIRPIEHSNLAQNYSLPPDSSAPNHPHHTAFSPLCN